MTFLYMMQPLVPQIYRFMLLCTMTLLTEFMPYRLSTFNAINSTQCPLSCIVLNETRENVLLISLLHITLSYIQERDSHHGKHPLFLQYRKKAFYHSTGSFMVSDAHFFHRWNAKFIINHLEQQKYFGDFYFWVHDNSVMFSEG